MAQSLLAFIITLAVEIAGIIHFLEERIVLSPFNVPANQTISKWTNKFLDKFFKHFIHENLGFMEFSRGHVKITCFIRIRRNYYIHFNLFTTLLIACPDWFLVEMGRMVWRAFWSLSVPRRVPHIRRVSARRSRGPLQRLVACAWHWKVSIRRRAKIHAGTSSVYIVPFSLHSVWKACWTPISRSFTYFVSELFVFRRKFFVAQCYSILYVWHSGSALPHYFPQVPGCLLPNAHSTLSSCTVPTRAEFRTTLCDDYKQSVLYNSWCAKTAKLMHWLLLVNSCSASYLYVSLLSFSNLRYANTVLHKIQ